MSAVARRPTGSPPGLVRRHPVPLAVLTALVVGAVAVVLLAGPPAPAESSPPPPPPSVPVTEPLRMPLTGEITDEVPDRPALLVKVSNSLEARPQTGLEQADVVFEELTEGGITRFVAVFHSDLPEVVGPVRSARPVDRQIVAGYGRPGFAFSGGREEVLALLTDGPAVVLTEGGAGFFRDDDGTYTDHPAPPHNLFLRPRDAIAAATAGGARPLREGGWVFADAPPPGGQADGLSIDVPMSPSSTTAWAFDPDAGLYRRGQGSVDPAEGGEHPVGAANVVVLDVRHYVGASGYPETDVLGEGDAVVLRDGQRYAARWSKSTADAPLRLLVADGDAPFLLKPGPTWIHLPDDLPAP